MPFRASKRLVWADLGPLDSVDMLVEVTFAGQTFRWSTRPVTMSDGGGAVLVFNGSLNALDFGTVLQTLADTPDQTSISLDVLWPVDVAELVAQGHDLSAATGELSAWVEGRAYEDRQVLVAGRVRQPNYGAFADPVSFTIEEAPFMDVGEWPATAQRAARHTWPTVQELSLIHL